MGFQDDFSPDPNDSVGPGSGLYIKESELTKVSLESVIKGGFGGVDIIKDDRVHTRTCPLLFRILLRQTAKDMGTSKKAICRHGIRQGLALLPARVDKVKEILTLYDSAGRLAMTRGSSPGYQVLTGGFSFEFIEVQHKEYQLPCYPEYRDILSDHAEAIGIPPSKLVYACLFLSLMTVPLMPGAMKTIQRELFHFGNAVRYRHQTLASIDKYMD